MNDYVGAALKGQRDDRSFLRQSIGHLVRSPRPALTVALEALMHEQVANPSKELDRDIAALLVDLGGDKTSLESMASMEGKTADVLYGIWRGVWSGYYAKKDRRVKAAGGETWPERKAREKRETEERRRLTNKEFKIEEIISTMKKTFANKQWVQAQKLTEGEVSAETIALYIRNRDSWAGQDILPCFDSNLKNLKKLSSVLLSDGVRYGNAVKEVETELNDFIVAHSNLVPYSEGSRNMEYVPKSPEDEAQIEAAYVKAIAKLKKVKGPSDYLKSLAGLPLPGGTMVVVKDWWSGVNETDKPKGELVTKLPALSADDIVKLANMTIEQFGIIKELEENRIVFEKVIYHDDGSPINHMYDQISESPALYDIVSDQRPNDVNVGDLIEAGMKACRGAFAYMDRSVTEVK